MNTNQRTEISNLIKQFETRPSKEVFSKEGSSSISSKDFNSMPRPSLPILGPSPTNSLGIRASYDFSESSYHNNILSKRFPDEKPAYSLHSERKFLSPVSDARRNSHQLPKVKSAKSFSSNSLKNKWEMITMLTSNTNCLTLNTAENVMKALGVLASEPGIYQEEMTKIVSQLHKCIFCSKEEIPVYIQNELYELYIDAAGSLNEFIPYFYLYRTFISINSQFQDKFKSQQDTIQTLKQGKIYSALEDTHQTKQQEISRLAETLSSVQLSIKPLTDENEKLQAELKTLQYKYQTSETNKKEVDSKLISVMANIKEDNKIIAELQDRLKKQVDFDNILSSENNSLKQQYSELNKKYNSMTSSYASLLAKLKQAFQKHKTYEENLKEIEEENYRLQMRAAVGFDDLTPRPNMQILFSELDKPFPPKATTISMVNIVSESIKSFKAKFIASSNRKMPRKPASMLTKKKTIIEENKRDFNSPENPSSFQSKPMNISQIKEDMQPNA